ncbi:deoxyguanosinetriphosphate triphosphohydrolase [Kitasatospora sp. NPDC094019]|uniref:deoxyguanosinetriphosphate triphosphohydrolase n=1 Tax=Kitasatospora sp. NPDC094019 TaxID=3364091 RepID=UPI003817406B
MDDTAHRLPAAPTPTPFDRAAEARWVPEPDKRPGRTAFQRDRARVLHSAALRRLAGTTQVVAPMRSDFPRTRLTHSLECAQVGRELGAALGCDPDLVETACLAHDIGHPPFGHTGEEALDQAAEACGGFEGNAQSLRILTRLEPKRFAPQDGTPARLAPWPGRSVGLNLSRAALDAATKYPWPHGAHPTDPASPKYGVYADDLPVFRWLRAGSPEGRKCFEATVMDWSDDVAYSTHDVEDGLQAGHIDPLALRAPSERSELFKVAERYARDAEPEELADALDRLLDKDWWPESYDGTARARAGLKDLTSQLIGRFCLAAEQATRARYGPGPLTRYEAELVVPREVRLECAVLKAVAVRYVMQRDEQAQLRARQRIVIAELAEVLTRRAPEVLDPVFAAMYEEAEDDRAALRTVVDQIATLTDASALALHARLTGPARS